VNNFSAVRTPNATILFTSMILHLPLTCSLLSDVFKCRGHGGGGADVSPLSCPPSLYPSPCLWLVHSRRLRWQQFFSSCAFPVSHRSYLLLSRAVASGEGNSSSSFLPSPPCPSPLSLVDSRRLRRRQFFPPPPPSPSFSPLSSRFPLSPPSSPLPPAAIIITNPDYGPRALSSSAPVPALLHPRSKMTICIMHITFEAPGISLHSTLQCHCLYPIAMLHLYSTTYFRVDNL